MVVDGTEFKLKALPAWHPAAAVTIAPWVWLKPRLFDTEQGRQILRHEAQHVRDQRRWHVLWWITYLFILPIGPSFKAFWEWRAYRITLQDEFERAGRVSLMTMSQVAAHLSSSLYLWAIPRFWAERLVAREVARLERSA
jgi:hypothetical protein